VVKKVKNFSSWDLPPDMQENWKWVCALDAYDYDDPEPLSKLITSSEQIPKMLRKAVVDIIQGKRKPNKKAAAKLKVPASERMRLAGTVSCVLGIIDTFKYEGLDSIASDNMQEPIDLLREMEMEAKELIKQAANDVDVSTETIENLLRDFRKKIEDWPNV
jgi:hypothetical protein